MQSLSPQERACPHWLPGVLISLCAAQPLLDVLSFWTQDLAWGSKLTLSLSYACCSFCSISFLWGCVRF